MNRYSLIITSRDNKCIKVNIPSDDDKFYRTMIDIISNASVRGFTIFSHKYAERYKWENYRVYDPMKEFRRQGIDISGDKSKYVICDMNANFEICKTYPKLLILPRFITKEEIIDCSNFRTKNRLPSNN